MPMVPKRGNRGELMVNRAPNELAHVPRARSSRSLQRSGSNGPARTSTRSIEPCGTPVENRPAVHERAPSCECERECEWI